MPTNSATAVTVFHRTTGATQFDVLDAIARQQPGFLGSATSADEAPLDWSWAVTFESEAALHRWLDGTARSDALRDAEGEGMRRASSDLVLVDGHEPPAGVGVVEHRVLAGQEADFLETQRELIELSAAFSGFEGASVVNVRLSGSRTKGDSWLSVLRFRTAPQLAAWMSSDARAAVLPHVRRDLHTDFTVRTRDTPFGSILRVEDGRTSVTPDWKSAMLVLLVLYPTVMTLSRFLGPVLDRVGAQPWLAMWLSQITSVALMTCLFMPWVTGWFRRWLDPVDGASGRVSIVGAAIVAGGYTLTLALFASVKWLQFWDYFD